MTRDLGLACLALCTAAALGVVLVSVGVGVIATTAPRDALSATAGTAAGLLAHNAVVALWPLALVCIGWPRLAGARRLGDVLVAGQLAGHGVLVGSALGQHPGLWRYLPHLPLEWLALAAPASAWISARRGTQATPRRLTQLAAAVVAVLALAALVETYLVPLP